LTTHRSRVPPDHEELIVKEALGTLTEQERKLLAASSL
jgi:hypothetical protein